MPPPSYRARRRPRSSCARIRREATRCESDRRSSLSVDLRWPSGAARPEGMQVKERVVLSRSTRNAERRGTRVHLSSFFFLITSNKSARHGYDPHAGIKLRRKHQSRGRSLDHDFTPVLYCTQLRGELRVEARPRTHTPRRRVTCHRLASATCIFIGAVFLSVAVVSSWRDSRMAGIVLPSRVLRPDDAVAKVINCHISKKRSVAERRGYEHAQQRSKENDNIKPT